MGSRRHRLRNALRDPALGRRLGWTALSPGLAPLHGALVVAVAAAAVLGVVGVGLLLLPPLLRVARILAGFERRQAHDLLGVPLAAAPLEPAPGLRGALLDAAAWRAVGWLAARAVVEVVVAGMMAVAALTAVALTAAPFAEGYLQCGDWRSPGGLAWAWTPLGLLPLGTAVLAVLAGVATVAARLASPPCARASAPPATRRCGATRRSSTTAR